MDPRAGLLTCNEAFLLLITALWIQKFKIELYRHDVPFDLNTSQLDLRWRIFFKFLGSLNWYDPRPLIGNKKITNQRIAKSWKIRVDLCEIFRPGLPINFYQIFAEQLLLPLLMPVSLSPWHSSLWSHFAADVTWKKSISSKSFSPFVEIMMVVCTSKLII